MANYWNALMNQRAGRRRVLAGTAAASAGLAFALACGGGSDKGISDKSSLITKPADTTKEAKRGGAWKNSVANDPNSWDPYPSGLIGTYPQVMFSRLLKMELGLLKPLSGEIGPDLAESWEFSPDRLQLTLKLRPNAKWDQRPPTNGRTVEAEDVVYSWERFSRISALRGTLSNAVNPQAAVVSVVAADRRTVVMKLASVDSGLLTLLATPSLRVFHQLPKETEQLDIRREPRGSGPYFLSEWNTSQNYVLSRNPLYWDDSVGYADRIERPVITEYATGLAQFRAGRLHDFPVTPEDVLSVKADTPDLLLYQDDVGVHHGKTFYGWQDGAKSPFRDERARQAFSMSWDRNLWIDTFYNASKFTAAGLPVEMRWNTGIAAIAEGWWLNPEGKDFGENAKYYKRDLAEAKKLLAAAGFSSGLDADAHYILTNQYGRDFQKQIEVLMGMGSDAGIRLKTVPADYNIDWDPKFRATKPPGNFDGVAWINMTLSDEPGSWLFSVYNSQGDLFKGFDPNGRSNHQGDPLMEDLTAKIKREFDLQKRWDLAHELQRYEAKKQYMTPFPGGASGFLLAWPALRNFRVYRGGTGGSGVNGSEVKYWIDPTKKPSV